MARGSTPKKVEGPRGVVWKMTVDVGVDPATGRRRQKKLTAPTRRELEVQAAKILADVSRGTYLEPEKKTLAEYLTEWLAMHGKSNLDPSTLRRYEGAIHQHIIPLIGSIPLAKLQPLHIQEMLAKDLAGGRRDNKKSRDRALSASTVLYHYHVLHKALNQAMKWRLITYNPADLVEPPRKTKTEKAVLNETEVAALLDGIRETYLYMPVFLIIYTGAREGEILALRWSDVDWDQNILHLRRSLYQRTPGQPLFKEPKNKKARAVDVSPVVMAELKKHRTEQRKQRLAFGPGYADLDLICCLQDGNPINPPTLSSVFRTKARRLGLPVTLHGLRHTHASLLLKAGVPAKVVSERLGHSQISITMDLYSHVMPGMQKDAVKKLDDLLAGKA